MISSTSLQFIPQVYCYTSISAGIYDFILSPDAYLDIFRLLFKAGTPCLTSSVCFFARQNPSKMAPTSIDNNERTVEQVN